MPSAHLLSLMSAVTLTTIYKSSATAELAHDAENVDFSVDDVRKT